MTVAGNLDDAAAADQIPAAAASRPHLPGWTASAAHPLAFARGFRPLKAAAARQGFSNISRATA